MLSHQKGSSNSRAKPAEIEAGVTAGRSFGIAVA
jgi:hypothetical protein